MGFSSVITEKQHKWLLKNSTTLKNARWLNAKIILLNRSIIGWKKIRTDYLTTDKGLFYNSVIAKLIIPYGAQVHTNMFDSKKRTDIAIVEQITNCEQTKFFEKGNAFYDKDFEYIHGNFVAPKHKFRSACVLCGEGIHFFLNFNEAKNY